MARVMLTKERPVRVVARSERVPSERTRRARRTRPAPGWWTARNVREKRLLLALAAVALGVLMWLLVVRPLLDARDRAERQLDAAAVELARARADAGVLKAAPVNPAGGAPVPLPLDGFLMTAGSAAGLTNLQVTADGAARATIALAAIRPQAFFGWLSQLESRGVVVESMSARPNADQTIAVEAVLRARSG